LRQLATLIAAIYGCAAGGGKRIFLVRSLRYFAASRFSSYRISFSTASALCESPPFRCTALAISAVTPQWCKRELRLHGPFSRSR
jgi:hypothetical protein